MKEKHYKSAGELLQRTKDILLIPNDIKGIRTGLEDLDSLTGGLRKGELICIAGRPAMGKTALALKTVMTTCMRDGKTCLYFTLAETGMELMRRLVMMDARVNSYYSEKILDENLKKEIENGIKESAHIIGQTNLFINDNACRIGRIIKTCRQLNKDKNIDAVIIDYLQIIKNDGHSKNSEKSLVRLKKLAKEMNCPVIVLSQLSRTADRREDHRPLISDLRGTEPIEYYFDKILLLYRDDYYLENSDEAGLADIIVARNYSGDLGAVRVAFIQALAMFEDYIFNDNEPPEIMETDEDCYIEDDETNENEYEQENLSRSSIKVTDLEAVIDMQYDYKDIIEINEEGIKLPDCEINFKECSHYFWNMWEREFRDRPYVGDRNSLTESPYFRFNINGKVLVLIVPIESFNEMAEKIREYGYDTYDLS